MTRAPTSSDRRPPGGEPGSAFGVLDECHLQTLAALDKLDVIVARLETGATDADTRALAADVVRHFSTTARQHHVDEERHVLPKLPTTPGSALEQTVLRLREDHHWLEEDWMELEPHLDAIASGQSWYDVAVLREGGGIFAALSREHIALEESVLYPEARARFKPDEQREMAREMTARRRAARRAKGSGSSSAR